MKRGIVLILTGFSFLFLTTPLVGWLNELVMQMTMKETEDGTSLMILALPSEEVKYLLALLFLIPGVSLCVWNKLKFSQA